jgi:hypothetical protein
MNMKQINAGFVNQATIKSVNVTDGMPKQFAVLSELLLEVDKDNKFYCGLSKGNDQHVLHAQSLMKEDPTIQFRKRMSLSRCLVSAMSTHGLPRATCSRHDSSIGMGTLQ